MSRKRRMVVIAVAVLGVVGAVGAAALANGTATVKIRDACDAASFNAVIGPGTCVDAGNVTFEEMIDSLVRHGEHPLWHNTPTTRTVHHGTIVDVANVGGEFHTFSRTEEFGGGFVPELNEVLGLEEIADGCLLGPGPTNAFVPAGGTGTINTAALEPGVHKFMCCIHPWMRSTLMVK
jgi:plastocyanin